MEGQWLGDAIGDSAGNIIVDLDDCFDHFSGTARLFAPGEPGPVCWIATPDRNEEQKLEVPLRWMPEGRPIVISREDIARDHPDMAFPEKATIELRRQDDTLWVRWITDIGTSGQATLNRSRASNPSEATPLEHVQTWDTFKAFALDQRPGRYIFRGQPEVFRLRTAFHRTHRKDLVRYVAQDIPLAHRLLTARTQHLFDLSKPEQFGAFWNLLQHHSYPTPLLDWTYSPFVAAFFAYRRRQRPDAPSNKVRIFAFDKEAWERDFAQVQAANFANLHFSMLEALAIENPRAIPQQALSTLTNVDDIGTYIRNVERVRGQRYLHVIDLPADLRREVMVELSFMGITAGSLFPGIDGTCEELRGRLFHQQ